MRFTEPERLTCMQNRVSVSRQIPAPASVLFGILARPANHLLIDGSGMLRRTVSGERITQPGDVFVMAMHNDEMGEYEMTNYVTGFEPDRLITWEPVMSAASREEDKRGIGYRDEPHRWCYVLAQGTDGSTVVTEIYDCSRAPEWLRQATQGGERWVPAMTETLAKLETLATAGS